MQKDFITVTPDIGSGNKDVTVQASQNSSTSQRNSTITISGGGMTRTINVSQSERDLINVLLLGYKIIEKITI